MDGLDGLKAEIRERWGDLPAAALCECIIDHVAGLPPGSAEGLTFGDLCRAAGREAPDGAAPAVVGDMATALAILVGSGANALDVRMVRPDADGGWHDAGPNWAEGTGGTSAGRLLPVFAPSERLRAALAGTAARRAGRQR